MTKIQLPTNQTPDLRGNLPYVPSEDIAEAVNLSIYLKRPLLVQGEPGCGKTQLANHVARELYFNKYGERYVDFYKEWYVKSTSKAMEGLYTFDHLARLRDVQMEASRGAAPSHARVGVEDYVSYGPLAQAFLEDRERCVVLIDEIDKADIDFPNDLLLELDEKRLVVREVMQEGRPLEIHAKKDPVIIVTSNNEKSLPDAFLRRCLYIYIEFPSQERLVEILEAHFPESDPELRSIVVAKFMDIRKRFRQSPKNVTTSELIDWFKAIKQDPKAFRESIAGQQIPCASVLIKSMDAMAILRDMEGAI